MQIVVLDSRPADQGEPVWDGLAALGTVTLYPITTPDQLVSRAASADAIITNKVVIDRAVVGALPHLRYVGIAATGTNAVDLVACGERGIAVTNVPGYATASVAQLVFALLLQLCTDVAAHDTFAKSGGWARSPDFSVCLSPLIELSDKTLAIFGLGEIGTAVAGIGRALGMHIVAGRVPGTPSRDGRVPLEEALAAADVVTLHCPLTESTRRMVDARFLAAMKSGAILVNTGRGALVDEGALLDALASGRLGGALLDVLEREPPARDNPLLNPKEPWAKRLVITPHIGWATVEARRRLVRGVVENLGAFLRGEKQNRVA